mgnify:CR=1 FL=1
MRRRRTAHERRATTETTVTITLSLDGGRRTVRTSLPFFDHMLELLAFHAGFGLSVRASGDTAVDEHHLVEDVGLVLGTAFSRALGDRRGIARYGSVMTPMDESLSYVAVDISGRPHLSYDVRFAPSYRRECFDLSVLREFFQAFVNAARVTLHVKMLARGNNHHVAESVFKGVGRALGTAVAVVRRGVRSSKGVL